MNPFEMLKQVFQKNKSTDEHKRKKLLESAIELEKKFLKKEIAEPEYKMLHNKIKLELFSVDLYKSLTETLEQIEKMYSDKKDLLEQDSSSKAKHALQESYKIEGKLTENKNSYDSGKIKLEEYVNFLKEQNSHAIDCEHELKLVLKKLENARVALLSEELRKVLTKKEVTKNKSEKMFDDVYLEAKSHHKNTSFIQHPKKVQNK